MTHDLIKEGQPPEGMTDMDLSEVCNMTDKNHFLCECGEVFSLNFPTAAICFGPGSDRLVCGRSHEALGTEDCEGDENLN